MASRLPAVTRLLAAVLLAAAFTSGAFQLDDEDLMFDDEDGTRSEAPVAAPMQDGVLGPLSRPKRQFLPYDSNDYVDYTDGSGSGFPPQIYMVKIHILRPWDSRFSNKGGAAFKEFKNEIMQPMQQVLHRVHRDATLEVDSIREGPSGQCMARLVVSMPDHEDRRENLVRNVRSELAKGRLGQLIVNTDYFEVTDYSGDVDNGDASSRVTGGCAADSIFTCKSGKIICDVQMCDGTEDCPDGDDEDGCGCEAGQFLCDSIRCQDESMKCDGIPDCADGTDEFNCGGDTTTIPGPFTTTSTRLQCLTDSTPQVCDDGVTLACFCDENPQCPNGEDESVANCGSDCPSGKVQCGTEPTCIESRFVCDGFQDCRNNWDEENCSGTTTPVPMTTTSTRLQCLTDTTPRLCDDGVTLACFCDENPQCPDGEDESVANCGSDCPSGTVQCGTEPTCINEEFICDDFSHCQNNWDEENCSVCPPGEQQCGDELTCVSSARICDGYSDCRNNWDEEQNCPLTCPPNMQMCREGRNCLAPNQICDGTPDCPEGSDEQECLCPEGYFRCFTGGNCINVTYRCDGLVQCPDGSDEEDCPCQVWQWTCRDGGCISQASRCDGTIDCNDKSDEYECPSGGCREGEFKCQSGSCVLEEDRCDGVNQCPDGSDEFGCPTPTCGPLEFTCADGKCVPAERKCDGYQDCADDSDEYSCCSSGQFQCGDGSCVPESARCNNVRDCPDDSDETDCPGCKTDEWTCRDGSCLPIEGRCDGYHQCWDSSDEENCPPKCRPDEFTCWDGSCVPDYLRCDGSPHCPDSSDEAECYPSTCTSNQWTCSDGSCIPQEKRCDQRYDCPDYTDEYNCTGCSSQEWTCLDRSCIPLENHCNGRYDCLDRSDEENCIASECRPDEFRCVSDYSCIPKSSQCNGLQECRDGSDEEQCAPRPTCKADEFACADDGTCIPSYLQCDGRPYCRDASDEHNCPSSCRPDQFRCDDGKCLEQWQKCNTISECSQGEDERSCPCRPEDHLCERDGTCIAGSKVCDGRPDCSDASDELNCPVRPPSTPRPELCNSDQFECRNGQCIARAYKCDGIPDCSDGSDEEERVCNGDDECSVGEIKCNDGLCIDKSWECDSVPDCFDGADELNCCKTTEFKCGDGSCIPDHFLCDTRFDCTDGSDEHNCECKQDEFHCNSGECVPRTVECDGKPDCRDGSDEGDYCPTPSPCTANEFHCQSGECVSQFVVCDGRGDCFDGSDELQCPDGQPGTGTCSESEFKCRDGSCVDRSAYCDRIPDCRDGSDEDNCTRQCASGEFQCTDRQCIRQESVCNRVRDCYDGSDEVNCPTLPPPPPPPTETTTTTYCRGDQFQCGSGDCIPQFYVCDGPRDCRDGSDEDSCTTTSGFTTSTTTTPPPQNTFQCQDGRIINRQQRCDGRRDCSDGSDEIDCPVSGRIDLKTFPDEQTSKQTQEVVFQCRDEGTTRAPVRWERDRGRPLPEGSTDIRGRLTMPRVQMEHEGVYYCVAQGVSPNTPGMRKPVYLRVEPYEVITASPPVVCSLLEATCRSGECINKTQVCDGRPDCKDSSDEDRCGRCEPNEFQCDNRKCVLKTWLCDSDNDCGDNSDEQYCGISDPDAFCHNNEFMCRSGSQCIPKSFHCDGDNDCMDLSDEDGCRKPEVKEPPPRNVMVWVGETFNITCRVEGVPTPIVLWRLNWGHVPAKCQMTSKNGFGMLVCPDAQPTDQGAYSCEAINGKGSVFATPDAIVVVKGIPINQCQPPSFNSLAISQEDCLSCFCFGITNDCFSTDMFITQLPPPNGDSFTLVGANQDQTQGNYVVRDNDYPLSSRHLAYNLPGTQYSDRVVLNVDRSKLRGPGDLAVYFSLPDSHKRQQLASFGGYLRYRITYSHFGASQTTSHPDVIIRGNGLTLMHVHDGTFQENIENWVDVRFFYGHWFKRVVQWGGRIKVEQPASREDIMMVLENMDLLLIRAQYTDGDFINTTLSNVQMDTAEISRNDQGQAGLVEKCVCPPGYTGISCQDCAPNYTRVKEGPWLGRCVYDLVCGPNEYGDPANGISCQPCPCPLGSPSNQFSSSCYLDGDGQVTCNCQQGYSGRRCQYCASGYEGNPTVPGDYCKPAGRCDPAGSIEADPVYGNCQCKEFVTGPQCDQCKEDAFYLSERNKEGCIPCFCMGITSSCSSSNLHRQQEYTYFTNDRQGFEIVDGNLQNFIRDDLFVDSNRQELVFRDFTRYGQKVYYWKLPQRFLGDKVTSYGGNLTYTLRFVPAPGGQSSTNSAYDVEIFGNDILLRHFKQGQSSLSPARQETISVPLYEQYWQRQNGQEVNREHLMMALADLEYIYIKATYTTATEEVGLKDVTLDYAEARNTGQERAYAVEMCDCPREYQGTSCEDCAIGYTRSTSGVHLGTCVPCDCSGHSTECDPDTGVCFNCKNNTAGNHCELCAPGYTLYGDTCYHTDSGSECICDPRGNLSCEGNRCQCKAHVIGTQCESCRPGYYHLSADNPVGCLPCWCSGVTSQCFSSNYYRMQIPMQLLFDHGFTFSNRLQTDVIKEGLDINLANNEISFSNFNNLRNREPYYWSLPQMFTGNRLESYGGSLTVTQKFQIQPGAGIYLEADVIIRSTSGREFFWMRPRHLQQNIPDREQTYTVLLTEDSFTMNQQPASRSEFLKALSSIEAILIRATLSEQMVATFLSDVIMDTAVPTQTGQPRAVEVEQCQCPMEYSGLSCETCKAGYYRKESTNQCLQCPCNGHESYCAERPDGSVQCECLPGYYGPSCAESDPPTPGEDGPTIEVIVSEPSIKVVTVNSTVQLACSARAVTGVQTRIPVTWSKVGGELPYGRARDNRQGLLVITEVRSSDSGVYICAAVDSYGRVVTDNVTLTVSRGRPNVIVEPKQGRFDINLRGSLEVRCSVEGNPEAQVTWTFGPNRPLPPNVYQQSGVLTFRDAQLSDRGEYYCTSTNAYGQGITRVYINVVTSPPGEIIIIEVSEENVVAQAGETVRVRCSASNIPGALNIEWSRLAGSLPQQSVVEQGELQIPSAQPADSGTYVCRITDLRTSVYNEASTRITITQYTSLPTVQIQPDRQTINQGTNAELLCRVSGDPSPVVTWNKAYESQSSRVSVENNILRITNAQVSDRGMYVCTAKNEGGTAQAAAIIEVERREPPQIEMHPQMKQTVVVGGSALFQCNLIAGIPAPTVKWTRTDGQPFSSNTEVLIGGVLRFNQVRGDEEGSYICTAENDVGSVTSMALLEVQSLPIINIRPGPSPYIVRTGDTVRLECFAEGDPPPSVSWKKLQVNYPTPGHSVSGRSGVTEYTITSVSKADEGIYLCSAENSAGTTDERLQLLVEDVLPGTLRPAVPPPGTGVSTGGGGVVYIPAGSPYEFMCSGEGPESDQLEFSFRRSDNRPLPQGSRTHQGTLYLTVVDESASGEYACVGRDRVSGSILFTIYTTIEVLVPPRVSLEPARQVVRPGEVVRIRCSATGLQPITIEWSKDQGRMPASVIINGGELTFRGIATTDAGRYICVARNSGGITRAVAEVLVNEEPLLTATDPQVTLYVGQTGELRCETSGINPNDVRWSRVNGRLPPSAVTRGNILRLPLIEIQDSGNYQCEVVTPSGMRLYDIVTLIVRRPQTSNIQIRSIPSVVHRGENVELICEVENEPAAAISWRRVDGDLPYGAESYGNILRIPSVQGGGIYMCSATTRQGIFDERFGLVIREDHVEGMTHRLRSGNTESQSVALGLSVTMECHLSLPGPVSYTWAKRDGKLPANARTDNAILDISKVQAEDAGYYVCTSWNLEKSADLSILLIVTDVVPRFNKSSYLALPTLSRAYTMFDIEITFKPESPDGLILYNSQRAGPDEGDFVAFGLTGGYPEFRFNIGAGPAIIRGTQPLEMNQWHTVKLSRNRKEGRMMVNGGDPVVGVSEGRFRGLDLVEPLFLGGVPDFQNVHRQTGMTSGFKGCISRLVTGNTLNTGFVMNAVKLVGITSCETCATDPCHNSGVCQEAYNERGHKCFCPAGYLGELCENAGESCYEGACGTGRCINKPGGFECYCPFGKIGERCSQDISIYEPAFGDESYIAFPTPLARQTFAVDMNVKPESLDDGLLMYCAQTESGSGDFTSLAIRNKRLEFRFNSGSGTANIQSEPITEGEWIKVRVNRTDKLGSLKLNDGPMVNGESPGSNLGLNLLTPLFIGGVDNSRIHVSSDVGVKTGFRGCVSEIRVMDQEAPLNEAVVDSANVDQCGGGVSPCSRSPCQNNGACVEDPSSIHGYTCHCINEYSGDNCEHEPGVCSMVQPCRNGGACIHQGHRYTCLCPLGFTGGHCERVVQNIGGSAAFSGSSWVELNRTLLPQESDIPQVISFEFRARRPNGLLFWYGQDSTVRGKGQDYISIAIKDGYVEFSYELGGGPAIIRSQSRVDDSQFHSLEVERTGQQGVFTLDRETPQVTHSPGDLHMLNANGNIYIGGAPDIPYMTGGIHTSGFIGCIQKLSIGGHTIDNFLTLPLSGVNVIPCPRQRGGRRKGPQRG